jgi:hypothetical protein
MEDVPLEYPINSLVSFHYFKDIDIAEMRGWGLRIIGDSGAFSALTTGAPVDVREFAAWGKRWKRDLFWLASLDVIGDPKGTRKNYEILRSEGLDVIPTIHYGADPSLLDEYAAEGVDFMGLGGMVGRKSEPKRLLRWTLGVFRYARKKHPQMRLHGWGVTHPELLMNLPWFSVDSSGFSSAYRYGRLTLFDPSTAKRVGIEMDGRDIYRHKDLVANVYGLDSPSRAAESTPATRRDLVRLSVSAVQKQEAYLQARFHVSAPQYGLSDSVDGVKIHAAVGFPGSQATLGISPTDKAPREIGGGPRIHAAFAGAPQREITFIRRDKQQ